MTNEQINIAIAEACGWRIAKKVSPKIKEDATDYWIRPNGYEWQEESLPDYCNDLNAMHEAVREVFTDSNMQLDYSRTLIFVIKKSSPICKRFFSDFDLATATARLHAETFLRILGKWEDAK